MRMFCILLALVWMELSIFSSSSFSATFRQKCEPHIAASAKTHGVPLGFLYAIGLTETGNAKSMHPYALNVAGKGFYPSNKTKALNVFRDARARGIKMIDLGCMQINYYYHSKQFNSVEEMLDPRKNVDYAARFLQKLFKREGSWTLAAARYHAGPKNVVAQKKYVCTVIRNLVASGFGKWTKESRFFCM